MKALTRTFAAAAVLALMAAPAYAQSLNTSANGTYGQAQLRSPTAPDPYTVTVVAGGPIDSTRANDECNAGFIAARPTSPSQYVAQTAAGRATTTPTASIRW
jgi:hypothetical protein